MEAKKHRNKKFKSIRPCKYVLDNISCPFEKFGCKFLHDIRTDKNLVNNGDILSDVNTMKTSTPIKSILSKENVKEILPCLGNCTDYCQCINCFVKVVLQNFQGEINMNDLCFD